MLIFIFYVIIVDISRWELILYMVLYADVCLPCLQAKVRVETVVKPVWNKSWTSLNPSMSHNKQEQKPD